jgi:dTDP-L-rhamnose 4-epimerase
MNKLRVLITGGAGFIGSHLAQGLLHRGHDVTVFDNFSPQIHGPFGDLPPNLRGVVELVRADVRDAGALEKILPGHDVVVHLAAETGTGQSMYKVRHYSDVNIGGTATLMELLLRGHHSVRSILVASSRAVYGEGAYNCLSHGTVYPERRLIADLKRGDFEPRCPLCGSSVAMLPTSEDAPFRPGSLYGLTKQVQEQMALMYARTLEINGFALRYQNVYGPGQSLRNPYTGILAIFSNQARANEPIYIFEDGEESRDFIFIDDVVDATVRCAESGPTEPSAFNVGTGRSVSVSKVVAEIVGYFKSNSPVAVNGAFREGDIRHNCADLKRVSEEIGFAPATSFERGIELFLSWAEGQQLGERKYEESLAEMRNQGLMHG